MGFHNEVICFYFIYTLCNFVGKKKVLLPRFSVNKAKPYLQHFKECLPYIPLSPPSAPQTYSYLLLFLADNSENFGLIVCLL